MHRVNEEPVDAPHPQTRVVRDVLHEPLLRDPEGHAPSNALGLCHALVVPIVLKQGVHVPYDRTHAKLELPCLFHLHSHLDSRRKVDDAVLCGVPHVPEGVSLVELKPLGDGHQVGLLHRREVLEHGVAEQGVQEAKSLHVKHLCDLLRGLRHLVQHLVQVLPADADGLHLGQCRDVHVAEMPRKQTAFPKVVPGIGLGVDLPAVAIDVHDSQPNDVKVVQPVPFLADERPRGELDILRKLENLPGPVPSHEDSLEEGHRLQQLKDLHGVSALLLLNLQDQGVFYAFPGELEAQILGNILLCNVHQPHALLHVIGKAAEASHWGGNGRNAALVEHQRVVPRVLLEHLLSLISQDPFRVHLFNQLIVVTRVSRVVNALAAELCDNANGWDGMHGVVHVDFTAIDEDGLPNNSGPGNEESVQKVLLKIRQKRVLSYERIQDGRGGYDSALGLGKNLLQGASVVVRVAMRDHHRINQPRRDTVGLEQSHGIEWGVHHDAPAVHPQHKTRGRSVWIKPMRGPKDRDAKERRVELL